MTSFFRISPGPKTDTEDKLPEKESDDSCKLQDSEFGSEHNYCAMWKKLGFCDLIEEKETFCRKTCNICDQGKISTFYVVISFMYVFYFV